MLTQENEMCRIIQTAKAIDVFATCQLVTGEYIRHKKMKFVQWRQTTLNGDQIVVRYSCVDGKSRNWWIAEDWRGKGKTHSIKGEEYFF
jgi:hypothetical protein